MTFPSDESLVDDLIEKANRAGHVAEEYAYNQALLEEAQEGETEARKKVLDRLESRQRDLDVRIRGEFFNHRITLGGDIVTAERALKALGPLDIVPRTRLQGQIASMKARKLELDALDLRVVR